MTKRITLPLTAAIAVCSALVSGSGTYYVMKADVDHLSERMVHVEAEVETLSSEVVELRLVQTSATARDTERWSAVERRLSAIEQSQSSIADSQEAIADSVREMNASLRRRR